MIEFLSTPSILILFAFLTGIFTKLADLAIDGKKKHFFRGAEYIFGLLWGLFAVLVVLGNLLIAAFYLGILLSWIARYKLDHYGHTIAGTILFFAIYWVHPSETIHYIIIVGTFVLFTLFGYMARHKIIKNTCFTKYNIHSFIFLGILTILYKETWIIIIASLANVLGYHAIKKWGKKRKIEEN
ncbi:MAG: hypothetical protein PF542_00305 [Nanoarchaeota archaeon]|jgi:hypothetical protein|nr:hypothetical protein [Nanoarchaeota archaeon]